MWQWENLKWKVWRIGTEIINVLTANNELTLWTSTKAVCQKRQILLWTGKVLKLFDQMSARKMLKVLVKFHLFLRKSVRSNTTFYMPGWMSGPESDFYLSESLKGFFSSVLNEQQISIKYDCLHSILY